MTTRTEILRVLRLRRTVILLGGLGLAIVLSAPAAKGRDKESPSRPGLTVSVNGKDLLVPGECIEEVQEEGGEAVRKCVFEGQDGVLDPDKLAPYLERPNLTGDDAIACEKARAAIKKFQLEIAEGEDSDRSLNKANTLAAQADLEDALTTASQSAASDSMRRAIAAATSSYVVPVCPDFTPVQTGA